MTIERSLFSACDKTDLVAFARSLAGRGLELIYPPCNLLRYNT